MRHFGIRDLNPQVKIKGYYQTTAPKGLFYVVKQRCTFTLGMIHLSSQRAMSSMTLRL